MRQFVYFLTLYWVVSATACQPASESTPTDELISTVNWEDTLERVSRSVVVIRVTATRSFDTEGSSSSQGTGFVVDAERGLILTNRHLVQPGPVRAQAIFLNHEEVDLWAVYRDPVHDFGLFAFDPSDVRYMEIAELELAPEVARIGLDIRVIGNDAGEKLSILTGTLARLDRAAPEYDGNGFNDFNTFYLQAASGTSGGSSGSPVIDIEGRVVGLNAGGRVQAASSFYLPLDRVVRALQLIQSDQPVARGTIQTIFEYTPYDELRRLGLSEEIENEVREAFVDQVGMLVVDQVIPEGPAEGALQVGDILVRVNGELTTTFVPLEEILDASVGQSVELEVERGGELFDVELTVGDLHGITPDEFIEVGSAVIHNLSYQQAHNHHLAVRGLYLAFRGYIFATAGMPGGALIRSIDGEEINDLDGLWDVLSNRADGQLMIVRWAHTEDPDRDRVAVVRMDRRWFPMQRCIRDDTTGFWPCVDAPQPPEPQPERDGTAGIVTEDGPGPTAIVYPSLAIVDFDIPYRIEAVWGSHFRGAGLVVDAERGLIAVDRDTVPIMLGDTYVTFGGSVRVEARPVFIHPVHNFSLISYDPADVEGLPIESANFNVEPLDTGDPIWLVGLDGDERLIVRETTVAQTLPLQLPYPGRPQFRESNIDVVQAQTTAHTVGGALADEDGSIRALWASFHADNDAYIPGYGEGPLFFGIPAELLTMVLENLDEELNSTYRSLGVEFTYQTLTDAQDRGLPSELTSEFLADDAHTRRLLEVSRVFSGFPAEDSLRGGDVVVRIDGHSASRFLDVERASQAESVNLDVLRDGELVSVDVETVLLGGRGMDDVVSWAGVLIHEPHLDVFTQRTVEGDGVYVVWRWYGTPASRYHLSPTRRIVEVDDVPTPDLETFLNVVAEHVDQQAVRISTLDLHNQPSVTTLRLDLQYFPTFRLQLGDDGWVRESVFPED